MTDFKPYPTYKDSGVEWLGEVPEHWDVIKNKYLVSFTKGRNPAHIYEDYSEGMQPYLSMDYLRGREKAKYSFPDTSLYLVSDGQPLIIWDGSNSGEFVRGKEGFLSSTMAAISFQSEINSKYYWYQCLAIENEMRRHAVGMGIPHVNGNELRGIKLSKPTSKEQTQIARFLDHETARMDALVAEQERLIELLKEKRRSLVLSTVNDTSLPEIRIAELVEVIQRPVRQLEGVEYVPLGLFNRDRGLFHRESREKQDMGESDFFWVKEGDLILSGQFAWEGAVAMAQETENKTVVSHRFPILKGKKGILRTEFLYSLLTTKHGDFLLNENSRGAAGRNRPLNLSLLLKEKIRVPSMLLQDEVAQLVNKEQLLIKEIEFSIELVKERRSALISAAVTGKIDVRNWQPEAEQKTA